jgi:type IV secretion system protein VirB11
MSRTERHLRPLEPCSALGLTLRALRPLLDAPGTMDVCINRPHEAFIETADGWHTERLPCADADWCLRLAKLIAHATRQRITEESPLLSASLASGERIQIVIPPATPPGIVAMSIRCPSRQDWSLDDLAARGVFEQTRSASDASDDVEAELLALLKAREFKAFLRLATCTRHNIVVSGPTGSGKTTLTKCLIQEIAPQERLITIEDSQELVLPKHSNHVRLLYSKDGQGLSRATPRQLIEASLRLNPTRVLHAELRADEAFDYLRVIASHPGAITSIHASDARLALEQLTLLVKQSPAGAQLPTPHIERLIDLLVDVVVQFDTDRRVVQILYDPTRKRRARDG